MGKDQHGSIRLFRMAGTDVWLHWSWLLVGAVAVQRRNAYNSPAWIVGEVLALFGIVLLHEYGHALVCSQFGRKLERIILWPVGAHSYFTAPSQPGAVLWVMVAGPLANFLLAPFTYILLLESASLGWPKTRPDAYQFIYAITVLNLALPIVNLLPLYPLDGGQVLRALLWFTIGPARSLRVASCLGLAGGVVLLSLALLPGIWGPCSVILAVFISYHAWAALQESQLLLATTQAPLRQGLACPSCGLPPPVGDRFWKCGRCYRDCDIFDNERTCLYCGTPVISAPCLRCHTAHAIIAWYPGVPGLACPSCGKAPPLGAHWFCGRCKKRMDPFTTGAPCPHCQGQIIEAHCLHCNKSYPLASWSPNPTCRAVPCSKPDELGASSATAISAAAVESISHSETTSSPGPGYTNSIDATMSQWE